MHLLTDSTSNRIRLSTGIASLTGSSAKRSDAEDETLPVGEFGVVFGINPNVPAD